MTLNHCSRARHDGDDDHCISDAFQETDTCDRFSDNVTFIPLRFKTDEFGFLFDLRLTSFDPIFYPKVTQNKLNTSIHKVTKTKEVNQKILKRYFIARFTKNGRKLTEIGRFLSVFSNFHRKLQFYVKWAFTKLPIITLYLLQLGYDRRLNLIFNHNR